TAPTDPTRTGYTFDSWVPAVPANMPAENVECVAQWTAINYTITWDANGGEGGTTTSEAYGSTPAGPTVTLAGYAFTGWEPEVAPVTGATTYTAQWELIPIALKEAPDSTTVIDTERYYIYGLVEGITQSEFEDDFVDILGNGRLEITTLDGNFGTGTKIELINIATDVVMETYIIIIFGDVNGDGYVGGVDADIIINVENYAIEWDLVTQDYLYFAGDLNQDGYAEAVDADIILNVENYALYIDQTTGITYVY
ncbi:MAG: hypothetical protein GXZ02_11420, partial [Clostridiales bacterium]|nr:hypothetical protein [Clostridiales bacterium]